MIKNQSTQIISRKGIKKKSEDQDYKPPEPRKKVKREVEEEKKLSQSSNIDTFLLEMDNNKKTAEMSGKENINKEACINEWIRNAEFNVKNHLGNISKKKFLQYFGVEKREMMKIYHTKEIDQLKKNVERKVIRLICLLSDLKVQGNRNQTWTKKFFQKHEYWSQVWEKITHFPIFLQRYLETMLQKNDQKLTVTQKDGCIRFQTYLLVQIREHIKQIRETHQNKYKTFINSSSQAENGWKQVETDKEMKQNLFDSESLKDEGNDEQRHNGNIFNCPCCEDERSLESN